MFDISNPNDSRFSTSEDSCDHNGTPNLLDPDNSNNNNNNNQLIRPTIENRLKYFKIILNNNKESRKGCTDTYFTILF